MVDFYDKDQSTDFGPVTVDTKLYNPNMSHSERLKSTFKSTNMGANGKFLGMDLDPALAESIRVFWDQTLPYIATHVGDHSVRTMQRFAQNFVTNDPKKALEFGNKWGAALAYSLVLAQPISETAANAYNSTQRLNELRQALSIILKANGKTPGIGGIFAYGKHNKMVQNTLNKIGAATMNNQAGILARSIAAAPAIYMLHKNQKGNLKAQSLDAQLEMLAEGGTPEQFDEFINKQMETSHDITLKMDSQLNKRIRESKKEYDKAFEKFKSSRDGASAVRKEIQTAIKDGTMEDYLTRYNLGNSGRLKKLDEAGLKKEFTKYENKTIDRRLKEKFAQEGGLGAWDASWLPGNNKYGNRNAPKTREEIIRESHEKLVQKIQEKITGAEDNKKGSKENEAMMNQGFQLIASLAGSVARKFVTKNTNKKLADKDALDMVLDMRRALDAKPNRDTIPGSGEDHKNEEYSYAHYVHKIFQEQQHDSGKAAIGDHHFTHLKAENWNDGKIQEIEDTKLTAYEVAIKHISDQIHSGRMDALALIDLVGEHQIVTEGGQPLGSSSDEQSAKEKIAQIIKDEAKRLKPNHQMDEEELSDAEAHYHFTEEEAHAVFGKDGKGGLNIELQGIILESMFMTTPDDKTIEQRTGLTADQVKDIRAQAQDKFDAYFDAALRQISDDIAQNPNAAEKYQLSEEQIAHFQQLAQKAQTTDAKLGGTLTAENRKDISATIANVLVDDSLHHSGRFWRDQVKPKAEQAEQQKQVEAKQKQQEKMMIANEDYGTNDQNFADRFSNQAPQINDNYKDSLPYVSEAMEQDIDLGGERDISPATLSHQDKLSSHERDMDFGRSSV